MKVVILRENGMADAETEAVSASEKEFWDGKADIADIPTNFDSLYYRENEIDTKLLTKSDTSHNHSLNSLTEKSYNSLTDKPTIPTDFNTLYYTKSEIDTKIGDIETLLEAI